MRTKTGILTFSVMCSALFAAAAVAADSVGEPGRADGKKNPLKNVYFGEQHMHTRNSFDAFTAGVGQTWDQAFKYGKGEEVTLSTTGEKIQKSTPYDFVAITDHSEYYGVLKDLVDPENPLSKSEFAQGLAKIRTDPKAATPYLVQLINSLNTSTAMPEYVTPELRMTYWQKYVATADKHYDPGKFTTLYAFEWTSIPNGQNMHRNVFFKDKAAAVTFSSFDSIYPEDLWTYLEVQRNSGIDAFALTAVPLFILTGDVLVRTGLSRKFLDVAEAVTQFAKGGFGSATVLVCGMFAAISGSDAAGAAAGCLVVHADLNTINLHVV